MQPKWLAPTSDAASASAADESTALELDQLGVRLRELDSELQGAFQDAHNTGFYINGGTTKVHSLGDKWPEGLQRIVRKITAQKSAQQASGSAAASTRQRNRERTHACLKKLVFLMNSMQVKSGSDLVFPILFDHMSFATHRCWETNMRAPTLPKSCMIGRRSLKAACRAYTRTPQWQCELASSCLQP